MSLDKFKGCLVGLATGDAMGAPIEWLKNFTPVTGMRATTRHHLNGDQIAGSWTDDTSMALCLAESLIIAGQHDPLDQLIRYHKWMKKGHLSAQGVCAGIGRTTRVALEEFQKTGQTKAELKDPNVAGNGSIMRLAPIPMHYSEKTLSSAITYSKKSSITTHSHILCVEACGLLGEMIWKALNGYTKTEIFSTSQDFKTLEIQHLVNSKTYNLEPPYIQGTGYVLKSLEAAMWAFYKTNSFRAGMLKAVNLGADADTTGAIYGQLAGAFYGYEAIPSEWKEKLLKRELIEEFATKLWTFK
jgi:ADP-ribosyl-[dinitrogen reductase] hydrolase